MKAGARGVRGEALPGKTGDQEARIVSFFGDFGFANDAARAAPALLGLVFKLLETARRGAAQAKARPRGGERGGKLLQKHGVFGQPQTVVNFRLALAPGHDLFGAKSAVASEDNPRLGAALTNGCDDLFQGGHHAVRRAVIGGAQLRPERKVARKNVERQVTIIIVIRVEVAALL